MLKRFLRQDSGASLVEYAITLIIVAVAGGVVLSLTTNISAVINTSAGAF